MESLIQRTRRRLRLGLLCNSVASRWYLQQGRDAVPGTVPWLIATEIRYGGFHTGVKRDKVSPRDHRSTAQLQIGGMTGGDRMLFNSYAAKYAQYLKPFLNRQVTLVEAGILRGVGLAIWTDLFQGRIIGLDIDLEHARGNQENLRRLGAFGDRPPELYEFDQFQDNTALLGQILNGDKIDIFIDDGLHSNECILATMRSALPHLAEHFGYFVEDNPHVHREIKALYPEFAVDSAGSFTVVTSRLATAPAASSAPVAQRLETR